MKVTLQLRVSPAARLPWLGATWKGCSAVSVKEAALLPTLVTKKTCVAGVFTAVLLKETSSGKSSAALHHTQAHLWMPN